MLQPTDLFIPAKVGHGTRHWSGSQASYSYSKTLGRGVCFELCLAFAYLLIKGKKAELRAADPYGPLGIFQRLTVLIQRFSTAVEDVHKERVAEQHAQRDALLAKHGITKASRHASVPKLSKDVALRNAGLEPVVIDKDVRTSPAAQTRFEKELFATQFALPTLYTARVPPVGQQCLSTEDRHKLLKSELKKALLGPNAFLMIDVGVPSHQILIATTYGANAEFDVFDPNGGYCTFAYKNDCCDWFVDGLIGETEYASSPWFIIKRHSAMP